VRVLGIETATEACSSAIVLDGRIAAELTVDRPRAHAEILMSQIDSVLSATGLTMATIDAVAVSIGPGSFTGLRIGLSVAKGLAWVMEKPLIGIPTLRALARKARNAGEPGESGLLLGALDVRKGEIYCRLDAMRDGTLTTVWEERAGSVAEIFSELEGKGVAVTGTSAQVSAAVGMFDNLHLIDGNLRQCSAGPVALEGEEALMRGQKDDISMVEPLYIRDFEPKVKGRLSQA
jgi:tRNA threonylcarbamoyladenosine biosynthesis protein TsaB